MDTNLKQSKKIRAYIYRAITFCALFTTLATLIIGREAFQNLEQEGPGTLTGEIFYLTEFREYMSELYTQAAIGLCGIADDMGYPFSGSYSTQASTRARDKFLELAAAGGSDLLYYVAYVENFSMTKSMFIQNITYPLFSEYDNHLLLPEDMKLCAYWSGPEGNLTFLDKTVASVSSLPEQYYKEQYMPNPKVATNIRIIIALRNTGIYESNYMNQLNTKAKGYATILWTSIISAGILLLFAPLCLFTKHAFTCAKKDYAKATCSFPLELKLLLPLIAGFICYRLHLFHFNGVEYWRISASRYLFCYPIFALLLYLFWTGFRQSPKEALRHSCTFYLLRYFTGFFTKIAWRRKILFTHLATFISAVLFISVGIQLICLNEAYIVYSHRRLIHYSDILGIILIVTGAILLLAGFYLKKFISNTTALTEKLSALHAGTPGEPLSLKKNAPLAQAAEHLNSLEYGMEEAIIESNRSNQMRVELITNVSHDLKTPLTSIINYADLLCEEQLPKPASEYAQALRDKSYRLKNMVQDVFEISKATSGNLPVELVELDFAKLIRQTLADMDERIQESNLTLKTNITTAPLSIKGDGEKLYRVFQNLIVNALQYSLENSRIHIYADRDGDYAFAKIKNTSKQELNFDTAKIVERFVRADDSRTTEGSGLGLSIAQSFTEACGGTFCVETDADMFTAHVRFPLVSNTDNA